MFSLGPPCDLAKSLSHVCKLLETMSKLYENLYEAQPVLLSKGCLLSTEVWMKQKFIDMISKFTAIIPSDMSSQTWGKEHRILIYFSFNYLVYIDILWS